MLKGKFFYDPSDDDRAFTDMVPIDDDPKNGYVLQDAGDALDKLTRFKDGKLDATPFITEGMRQARSVWESKNTGESFDDFLNNKIYNNEPLMNLISNLDDKPFESAAQRLKDEGIDVNIDTLKKVYALRRNHLEDKVAQERDAHGDIYNIASDVIFSGTSWVRDFWDNPSLSTFSKKAGDVAFLGLEFGSDTIGSLLAPETLGLSIPLGIGAATAINALHQKFDNFFNERDRRKQLESIGIYRNYDVNWEEALINGMFDNAFSALQLAKPLKEAGAKYGVQAGEYLRGAVNDFTRAEDKFNNKMSGDDLSRASREAGLKTEPNVNVAHEDIDEAWNNYNKENFKASGKKVDSETSATNFIRKELDSGVESLINEEREVASFNADIVPLLKENLSDTGIGSGEFIKFAEDKIASDYQRWYYNIKQDSTLAFDSTWNDYVDELFKKLEIKKNSNTPEDIKLRDALGLARARVYLDGLGFSTAEVSSINLRKAISNQINNFLYNKKIFMQRFMNDINEIFKSPKDRTLREKIDNGESITNEEKAAMLEQEINEFDKTGKYGSILKTLKKHEKLLEDLAYNSGYIDEHTYMSRQTNRDIYLRRSWNTTKINADKTRFANETFNAIDEEKMVSARNSKILERASKIIPKENVIWQQIQEAAAQGRVSVGKILAQNRVITEALHKSLEAKEAAKLNRLINKTKKPYDMKEHINNIEDLISKENEFSLNNTKGWEDGVNFGGERTLHFSSLREEVELLKSYSNHDNVLGLLRGTAGFQSERYGSIGVFGGLTRQSAINEMQRIFRNAGYDWNKTYSTFDPMQKKVTDTIVAALKSSHINELETGSIYGDLALNVLKTIRYARTQFSIIASDYINILKLEARWNSPNLQKASENIINSAKTYAENYKGLHSDDLIKDFLLHAHSIGKIGSKEDIIRSLATHSLTKAQINAINATEKIENLVNALPFNTGKFTKAGHTQAGNILLRKMSEITNISDHAHNIFIKDLMREGASLSDIQSVIENAQRTEEGIIDIGSVMNKNYGRSVAAALNSLQLITISSTNLLTREVAKANGMVRWFSYLTGTVMTESYNALKYLYLDLKEGNFGAASQALAFELIKGTIYAAYRMLFTDSLSDDKNIIWESIKNSGFGAPLGTMIDIINDPYSSRRRSLGPLADPLIGISKILSGHPIKGMYQFSRALNPVYIPFASDILDKGLRSIIMNNR